MRKIQSPAPQGEKKMKMKIGEETSTLNFKVTD
jgi:hypothetical protein